MRSVHSRLLQNNDHVEMSLGGRVRLGRCLDKLGADRLMRRLVPEPYSNSRPAALIPFWAIRQVTGLVGR